MKTINQTRIGKFLSDHNLGYLLSGVADMPPSVPLLVWLNDAVQDDNTMSAKHKQVFGDLCRAELEDIEKKKNDHSREPIRREGNADRRRRGSLLSGLVNLIMF